MLPDLSLPSIENATPLVVQAITLVLLIQLLRVATRLEKRLARFTPPGPEGRSTPANAAPSWADPRVSAAPVTASVTANVPAAPAAQATDTTVEEAQTLSSDTTASPEQPAQTRSADPIPQAPSAGQRSPDALAQLYAQWCREHRRPHIPDNLEASRLRMVGTERVSELAQPTYLFQDHPQTGEFLRFSKSGEDVGAVLPDPESRFEPGVHKILFPRLTPQQFSDPEQLATLVPVRLQKRPDGLWQKAL
jgi:hypothetical protein